MAFEPGLCLDNICPFSKSLPPPFVILDNGMELREVNSYRPYFIIHSKEINKIKKIGHCVYNDDLIYRVIYNELDRIFR